MPLLINYMLVAMGYHVASSECLPVGTDQPTIRLLNHHVRDKIAPKWRNLGIELLNEEQCAKLDVIEGNHPQNVERCCTEIFEYWLRVDPQASWKKLIIALEQIDENVLAESIMTDVLKGQTLVMW